MTIEIHKADSRGIAEQGWLSSRHTFSFAGYHDPTRMGFGALRVINDDVVQAGKGFGTHPHDNMEIISIPITGCLKHKDSMGNEHIISAGEVQVMSAGTGITHSEYNHSDSESVNFLQIWVLPKEKNISPTYGQKAFSKQERINKFQQIVSPDSGSTGLWINQNAYFSLIDLAASKSANYETHSTENGVYIFIISGDVNVSSVDLSKRDGVGIAGEKSISLSAINNAQVLCMEVPME